jgi:predicted transcriptional regulator
MAKKSHDIVSSTSKVHVKHVELSMPWLNESNHRKNIEEEIVELLVKHKRLSTVEITRELKKPITTVDHALRRMTSAGTIVKESGRVKSGQTVVSANFYRLKRKG